MLLSIFLSSLSADWIETFYGGVEVEEKVLLELIESDAFKRLKDIHQYGIGYYTTHKEDFSRHSHSLGVFHLLRQAKRPLKEQVAGLLHDVSHTVFSHVGDWVFDKLSEDDDYQNSIHERFLEETGLAKILRKHGIEPSEILPLEELFPALEASRPDASADRLDYSIQGAYHQNFLTKNEAIELFNSLEFTDGKWISNHLLLTEKMIRFILFMTEDCFASVNNYLASRWLADAILRAIEIDLISFEEFHTSTDDLIWEKLISSKDAEISLNMQKASNVKNYYSLTNPADCDCFITTKFFGFDPYVNMDGSKKRITKILPELKAEYQRVKDKLLVGFAIKFNKSEEI
jgi:hypothetical protein